jgi:hypothetical protein
MEPLQIAKPLKIDVVWYDKCVVPQANKKYEGEVIGWRNSQIIVSVTDYAVLRFWKKSGLEVGNKDHARRGFIINVEALGHVTELSAPGVSVTFSDDG